MQNRKEQDALSVNIIKPDNGIKPISQKAAGNAGKDPFCVYDHKRHAVGSKIKYQDGSEAICTKDSTWQNTKQ